jgi:hypothetical protein
MSRRLLPCLFLVLAWSCVPKGHVKTRHAALSDELPVTRVVLYQNGIGYFEREGEVDSDHLVLRIRPDQIADFLKSLTIVDKGTGMATSVALPVEKSQARQLADLPPQVQAGGGILAIAMAFRGARATVHGVEGSATGRIVGVERIEVPPSGAGEAGGTDWRLTILDGSTLRNFSVSGISSLKIHDKTLTVGLEKALDVTLNEGSWKPIELTVELTGPKPHHLIVSYVIEMPTWKPAYRVVVGKEGALLQGWAVVDNVSGADWEDVTLSLTAGTPLAFTYDLYTPHYVRRPDLSPPQEEYGMAPPDMAPGYAPAPPPPPAEMAKEEAEYDYAPAPAATTTPGAGAGPRGRAEAPKKKAANRAGPVTEGDLERNYRSLVAGAGVGALFRYDLKEPVTVRDRESALVSVVSQKVKGEDVLVFRVGVDGVNPYRAVRLVNETPFVLERGPVAIYRDATFLGEAVSQRMDPGVTAFVPYALDGRVAIFLAEEYLEQDMKLVTIVNGRINIEAKRVTRYLYEVDNRTGEEIKLYVHRARRTGWTITNVGLADAAQKAPPQPGKDGIVMEETGYYVPLALPKTGQIKFVVEEETPGEREVEILSDEGRKVIRAYVTRPDADPAVAKPLGEAADISDRLAEIERRLTDLEEQRALLNEREQQVRDNLNMLKKSPANADLRAQQEKRLAEIEKSLDGIVREIVQLSDERSRLTERLVVIIKGITLKRK